VIAICSMYENVKLPVICGMISAGLIQRRGRNDEIRNDH
jgi:hypothetical protein